MGIRKTLNLLSNKEVKLEKNDIFMMFTDGITEAKDENETLFGVDRMKKILMKHSSKSSLTIYKTIMDDVAEFTKNDSKQKDDMTMIIGIKK